MASTPKAQDNRPRLYLVTPVIEDADAFERVLRDAVTAADVAAVLLRLKDAAERDLINRIKVLAPAVQGKDVALLLDGHAELAARAGADGAHLTGVEAFAAAVESLKPARIAGCGGVNSRDDAMFAGERGADYVMFGQVAAEQRRPSLEATAERLQWWSELFTVPCVGFAANPQEIQPLLAAGAEFIAVGDFIWDDPRGPATALAEVSSLLKVPETT